MLAWASNCHTTRPDFRINRWVYVFELRWIIWIRVSLLEPKWRRLSCSWEITITICSRLRSTWIGTRFAFLWTETTTIISFSLFGVCQNVPGWLNYFKSTLGGNRWVLFGMQHQRQSLVLFLDSAIINFGISNGRNVVPGWFHLWYLMHSVGSEIIIEIG